VASFGGLEESWAKFFIYNPSTFQLTKDNLRFFQNKAYDEQIKHVFDPASHDLHGFTNIPNSDSFYFVLFAKQMYLLASRRDQLVQTVKVLDLD